MELSFIQITSTAIDSVVHLYGLTDDGKVYYKKGSPRTSSGWVLINMEEEDARELIDNLKEELGLL